MQLNNITKLVAFAALAALTTAAFADHRPGHQGYSKQEKHSMMMMDSGAFRGVEVNGGHVSVSHMKGKTMLTLSSDFMIPKSPAPQWQVVDSKGNTYLLQQLRIAGDKTNRTISLPKYIKDVAKVQIWCSFAEVVLGEASFAKPQMVG